MEPVNISLSRAVWWTAFPNSRSEGEWLAAHAEKERRIEELMPAARAEWRNSGFEERDFDAFDNLSGGGIRNGYLVIQRHFERWPKTPAFTELIRLACDWLRRWDEHDSAVMKAETDLHEAGWLGHAHFLGIQAGFASSTLEKVDPSYFRHRRIFHYLLGDDNADSIASDPIDDRQKGHIDYDEVAVDFASFKAWMLATGHWTAKHDTGSPSLSDTGQQATENATASSANYFTGAIGRPSSMHLIKAEAERRFKTGHAPQSYRALCRELSAWLEAEHPEAAQATPKAIANNNELRSRHRDWKSQNTVVE